ncbi:hypothetical protein [Lignipirellula cremea]|uniref:hypothetical protein n=1 Tax=Lignipirellula cremea TaxID=2528010 RepID=UPI0011A537E2|nr:hypothetical protein [Lignipirellula cremea]
MWGSEKNALIEWFEGDSYALVCRDDTTGRWRLWELRDNEISVSNGMFPRSTVFLDIPERAANTPTQEYLDSIGLNDSNL